MALPPGTIVGSYKIVRVLGHGGFGITYLAGHTALGKHVALKELFPADFATRDTTGSVVAQTEESETELDWALERFVEEARNLCVCEHPNVLRVLDVFRANGTAYMPTAFEEGATLSDWLIKLGRKPSEEEVMSVLMPLLSGLEKVHQMGLLHRDIKPDNIYLCSDGRPVLLDFGAARQAIGSRSRPVTSLVSSGYTPLEQYSTDDSGHVGPATDLYALAATMHKVLTGEKPPDAPRRLSYTQPDPLMPLSERLRGSYSAGLLGTLDRCLAVVDSDRCQSVHEFRDSLGRPPTVRPRTVRKTTRRPIAQAQNSAGSPWPIIASAVVLASVGVAGWLWFAKEKMVVANTSPVLVPKPEPAPTVVVPVAAPAAPTVPEKMEPVTPSPVAQTPTPEPKPLPVVPEPVPVPSEENLAKAWKAVHLHNSDNNLAAAKRLFQAALKDADPIIVYHGQAGLAALASVQADGSIEFAPQLWKVGSEAAVEKGLYGHWYCDMMPPYGFVDQTGKLVAPRSWYDINEMSEGLAAACKDKEALYGYIDKTGKLVIDPEWQDAGDFHEGLASVRKAKANGSGYGYGFIDRSGKLVIAAEWESVEPFYEGLASVSRSDGDKDTVHGYVNRMGNLIGGHLWNSISEFNEGMAFVNTKDGNVVKWGIVNRSGTLVIDAEWDWLGHCSDGLIAVGKKTDGTKMKYGYVDKAGKLVIPLVWDEAHQFEKGLARVGRTQGKNVLEGIIDTQGHEIVPPEWAEISAFHEGIAIIATGFWDDKNRKLGAVNTQGKQIVAPVWGSLESFAEGLAAAGKIVSGQPKYGYINCDGEEVIPFIWDSAGSFGNGIARVRKEDRESIIDKTGKVLVESRWDGLNLDGEEGEYLSVRSYSSASDTPNSYGILDRNGKVLVPLLWHQLKRRKDRAFGYVRTGNELARACLVDMEGRILWSSDGKGIGATDPISLQ